MRIFKNLMAAFALVLGVSSATSTTAFGADSIAGTYEAMLIHDGGSFYQFGKITLRTVNVGGQIQVSANARVAFGPATSTEYLTYEYDQVPFNILTRQLNIHSESAEVSFIGVLRGDTISGEWFSALVGYAGTFEAKKGATPATPAGADAVTTLSGYYEGSLTNTNERSNLPEDLTFSFVSTQGRDDSGRPTLVLSGKTRFYFGDFNSSEYEEVPFVDVQFNFYNRFLTARTERYGLTFKGTLTNDGIFAGEIFSDSLGKMADTELEKR